MAAKVVTVTEEDAGKTLNTLNVGDTLRVTLKQGAPPLRWSAASDYLDFTSGNGNGTQESYDFLVIPKPGVVTAKVTAVQADPAAAAGTAPAQTLTWSVVIPSSQALVAPAPATAAGMPMGTVVAIGAGALVLGIGAWWMLRKRNPVEATNPVSTSSARPRFSVGEAVVNDHLRVVGEVKRIEYISVSYAYLVEKENGKRVWMDEKVLRRLRTARKRRAQAARQPRTRSGTFR